MCGSVAAGRLYTKYRAGGGEGVWQRIRLRIGLHTLGYREWTRAWAGLFTAEASFTARRDFELFSFFSQCGAGNTCFFLCSD